jgi:ribosome-associated protein
LTDSKPSKRPQRSLSRHKAQLAAAALLAKKAREPVLLDLRPLTPIADYFLICHGSARPHVRALADAVAEALRREGAPPRAIEGYAQAHWILMDCGDLIVHIFSQADREYFDLERLWGDAARTEIAADELEGPPAAPVRRRARRAR